MQGNSMMSMKDKKRVVLSGTFNPLHWGHESLLGVGSWITKLPPYFEMSIRHSDKAAIGWQEVVDRQLQFQNKSPLILTDAPYYFEKAEALPNTVFVLGFDSLLATVDETVEPLSRVVYTLETFKRNNCSFLVACRETNGVYQSLSDLPATYGYDELFQPIPETLFKAPGVSSTKLRELQ